MVDIHAEIAELEEKLRQADITSDPAVIDQLFADDAAITGRDGKMFTKQDVIKAHQPAGRQRVTRIDVSDLEIRDHGASAVVTGRIDLVDPGFPAALRFTRVWMKRGGRWQILAGHVSPISAWSSLPE
jgi:hypothetical protein